MWHVKRGWAFTVFVIMRRACSQILERLASNEAASTSYEGTCSYSSIKNCVRNTQESLKHWTHNAYHSSTVKTRKAGMRHVSLAEKQQTGSAVTSSSFQAQRHTQSFAKQFFSSAAMSHKSAPKWKAGLNLTQQRKYFRSGLAKAENEISHSSGSLGATRRLISKSGRGDLPAPLVPIGAGYAVWKIWMAKPFGVLLRTLTLKNVGALARTGKLIRYAWTHCEIGR